MDKIDTKTKLSALWLFILLNIIFRDLHQFGNKPFLEMLLSGTYNGIEVTEELMLLGGFLAEVPIAMVLFSLLLTRRIGRPVTFVAAFITAATLVSSADTRLLRAERHGRRVSPSHRACGNGGHRLDGVELARTRNRPGIGRQGRQYHQLGTYRPIKEAAIWQISDPRSVVRIMESHACL
jgi:hypothetical protein